MLEGPTEGVCGLQDGCSIYMDSYMALNGSCFMVTWTIFKKPGDHGTPNTHNHWFILFYHVWGPAWIDIHWDNIWLRAGHIWLRTALEGPWQHYMMLEVSWDALWTLSFGLSQFHGHGSWLVWGVALKWLLFFIWPLYLIHMESC